MHEGWRPGGEDRRQAGRCPGAPPLAVQAPCCPPSPHSAGAVSGSQLARVRCRPAPPGQLDGLMWTAGARQRISLRLDASIGLTRHGAAAAGLRQAPRRRGISGLEAPIGVGECPVGCALMSGLSRGVRRWPSWVCACVSGANLARVLGAQERQRLRLSCLTTAFPIPPFGACRRIGQARARRLSRVSGCHAVAAGAAAACPVAR